MTEVIDPKGIDKHNQKREWTLQWLALHNQKVTNTFFNQSWYTTHVSHLPPSLQQI